MPATSPSLRAEYREAIALIARAVAALERRNIRSPILVGGAAVEFYTGGAITTGDFDFVTPYREEFFEELERVGFRRPGQGEISRALFHPSSGISVEVVSGQLMDGRADNERLVVVRLRDGALRVIPIEDVIADRIGQALAGSRIDERMRNQAIRLYQLAGGVDRSYLDRRIAEEASDGHLWRHWRHGVVRIIDFENHERELAARKAALGFSGYDHVMRNDGARRTPEKRAILRELKRMGSPFLEGVDVDEGMGNVGLSSPEAQHNYQPRKKEG